MLQLATMTCAIGCGSFEGNGGSTSGNGDADVGEDSGDPHGNCETTGAVDPSDDWPVGDCQVVAMDHSADCADGCPITLDYEVDCNDDFKHLEDVAVAASADASYLAFSTSRVGPEGPEAWLYRLGPDDQIDRLEVPAELDFRNVRAASDPAGVPHFLSRKQLDYAKYMWTRLDGDEFTVSETQGILGDQIERLVFVPSGTAHLWTGSYLGIRVESTVSPGGDWATQFLYYPGEDNVHGAGVRTDGTHLYLRAEDTGSNAARELAMWNGEALQSLGDATPELHLWLRKGTPVAAPALPAPQTVFGSDLVFKVGVNSLEVVWNEVGGLREMKVNDAPVYNPQCETERTPQDGDCGEPCVDFGGGVEGGMSAIAQTVDGRYWLVWLETHLDRDLCFEYQPAYYDADERCVLHATRFDGYGELVLASLDPEAETITQILRIRSDRPYASVTGPSSSGWADQVGLDVSSYAQRLSIGLLLDDSGHRYRVLEVDTSSIP